MSNIHDAKACQCNKPCPNNVAQNVKFIHIHLLEKSNQLSKTIGDVIANRIIDKNPMTGSHIPRSTTRPANPTYNNIIGNSAITNSRTDIIFITPKKDVKDIKAYLTSLSTVQ